MIGNKKTLWNNQIMHIFLLIKEIIIYPIWAKLWKFNNHTFNNELS
jgi:hypothetical protein